MPAEPASPLPDLPESRPRERSGIGIFQMLGLGLLLLTVLFVLIAVVWSLFTPS
ncbi:MAG: hypothetical protein KKA22_04610 [Gammaproteobacteria bacterium]|nr:hypothetical protein [Gammaproteobacteria bacterium]MBU1407412.1 hypothetical protein [Gammaproteobacteria bacterium]MBU1531525.1 hypothetical protein [Gammaproteobacteria bacterium]